MRKIEGSARISIHCSVAVTSPGGLGTKNLLTSRPSASNTNMLPVIETASILESGMNLAEYNGCETVSLCVSFKAQHGPDNNCARVTGDR